MPFSIVMRIVFLIVGQILSTPYLFGQGTIQFNNRVTGTSTSAVVAPIYGVDPSSPLGPKYGNAATGPTTPIPTGTQVYGGQPLTGTGYTASLWARQAGTQNPFVLAATTPFRVTTSTALYGFWTVPSTAVVLPNVPSDPSIRADILIRVWDNRGGMIASWDQLFDPATGSPSWLADVTLHGESQMFTTRDQLGGGVVLPPTLVGLQSFQLWAIPEPSSMEVLAFGGGALLLWTSHCRRTAKRNTR